ncbi:unnamed protein product [Moneuplotes crassus]|uniref:CSC1/OSCA1-like cytosolic domain-containing protein n=1 Tax=Euplotes crassus TaxID=5936 RepID=A0AAD1XP57_EUPCR|nr:unnamed protein product [Moneuplotes crassus]
MRESDSKALKKRVPKNSEESSQEQEFESSESSEASSVGESVVDTDEDLKIFEDPMDKMPPDFTLCRKHYEASTVKDLRVIKNDKSRDDPRCFCQCCYLPLNSSASKFSFWANFTALSSLGASFALFFRIKYYMLAVLLVWCFFASVLTIPRLSTKDRAAEFSPDEEVAYISDWSLGNFGKCGDDCEGDEINGIMGIHFCALISIVIIGVIYRFHQFLKIRDLEKDCTEPSNFAVLVSNIPRKKNEEEIREWLASFLHDPSISYVNMCYNVSNQNKKIKGLMNLRRKRRMLLQGKKNLEENKEEESDMNHRSDEIEQEIKEINEEIYKVKKMLQDEISEADFCKKAFVVFEKSKKANHILGYFNLNYFTRLFYFIKFKICRSDRKGIEYRYWDNHTIHVERAADPKDILWENLSISLKVKLKRNIITYTCTFICLGVSFGLNLAINSIIDVLRGEESSSAAAEVFVVILSILSSILVSVINIILEKIIRELSAYERHDTYTKLNLSVSLKLTFATFINTGILPLFLNFGTKNWFHSNGLMNEVFYNMLSISFVSPILYLFDVGYITNLIKMRIEEKKGENSTLTQREANALFEPPPVDMAQRYSDAMLMLCMVAMYTFVLPIIPVVALFGTLFQYSVEKYLLITRHKLPERLGSELASVYIEILPLIAVIYGFSVSFFGGLLVDQVIPTLNIFLAVSLIYFCLPIQSIIRTCYLKRKQEQEKLYSEHRLEFMTDYDRENPRSSQESWEIFLTDKKKEMKKYIQIYARKGAKQNKNEETKKVKRMFSNIGNFFSFNSTFQNRGTWQQHPTYRPQFYPAYRPQFYPSYQRYFHPAYQRMVYRTPQMPNQMPIHAPTQPQVQPPANPPQAQSSQLPLQHQQSMPNQAAHQPAHQPPLQRPPSFNTYNTAPFPQPPLQTMQTQPVPNAAPPYYVPTRPLVPNPPQVPGHASTQALPQAQTVEQTCANSQVPKGDQLNARATTEKPQKPEEEKDEIE